MIFISQALGFRLSELQPIFGPPANSWSLNPKAWRLLFYERI
jgi:hypothetical protein